MPRFNGALVIAMNQTAQYRIGFTLNLPSLAYVPQKTSPQSRIFLSSFPRQISGPYISSR